MGGSKLLPFNPSIRSKALAIPRCLLTSTLRTLFSENGSPTSWNKDLTAVALLGEASFTEGILKGDLSALLKGLWEALNALAILKIELVIF